MLYLAACQMLAAVWPLCAMGAGAPRMVSDSCMPQQHWCCNALPVCMHCPDRTGIILHIDHLLSTLALQHCWHAMHVPLPVLTVGIMSSWNCPVVSTFTSELLPAFCSPISDSSISRRKNRLQTRTGTREHAALVITRCARCTCCGNRGCPCWC